MCNDQGCNTTSGYWYAMPVTLTWAFTGIPDLSPSGCGEVAPSPMDLVVTSTCSATFGGNLVIRSYTLRVEISSPTVSAAPSRPPDADGWYNRPVSASVTGTSFSGIASCTPTTYSGPDSATATVSGTCTDKAGKTASATSAPFGYDASPPTLVAAASPADGRVALSWVSVGDIDSLASVRIVRAPGRVRHSSGSVYNGSGLSFTDTSVRDGVRYAYTLIATDQAGNVSEQTLYVVPGPRLLVPASGAVVPTPPLLEWTPVRRAAYYNVQLFRGRQKILSQWPTWPRLHLRRRWRFDGHRYLLRPGRYRWYVWPGLGPRPAARYARVIGSLTFVVTRPA